MSSTALFRAVLLGLLLANTMLLIELAPLPLSSSRCRPVSVELKVPDSLPPSPESPELNVVDVRREELDRVPLREILGLGSTDRIVSVNDRKVENPRAALARAIEAGDAGFLDLTVSRRGRPIRTIVLLHGGAPPEPALRGLFPPQKSRGPGG